MKKNIKSFLAMALCLTTTISSCVVPTLAATLCETAISNDIYTNALYSTEGIHDYTCPYTGAIYKIAVYKDASGNLVRYTLDGSGNIHPDPYSPSVLPNEEGLYYKEYTNAEGKKLSLMGLSMLESLKRDFPLISEEDHLAYLFDNDCFTEYGTPEYVDACTIDGVYTYCPELPGEEEDYKFNEVSKLLLTNATVTALFDRPYKDLGYMDNYLSYVSESIESYFCPTLGIDLYNGSAAGFNKVLVNNRVIQIPVGTTMSVPTSTALEIRYLSGDGSSIEDLRSAFKTYSLSSVIYNLASNNVIGHFSHVFRNNGTKEITFKDSGMYTLFAQATPFELTKVHGQDYYTSKQFSLMLQYSVFLIVSNEGLPFSWYLPGDNNYNYIGTIVSPVVGTVAIPSTGIMHTVEEGDTLYSLAKTYYGSELFVNKVYNANAHRIADQTALIVGQQVYLPK